LLGKSLLFAIAFLALLNLIGISLFYLAYPGYIDTGEPNIVIHAWRLLEGYEVYPSFESPERTTNLYGPYIFLLTSIFLFVFGPSIFAGKIAAFLAALSCPLVIFFSQKRRGLIASSIALIFFCEIFVINLPVTIWNRPDIFLGVILAVTVWSVNKAEDGSLNLTILLALLMLLGGVALDLKIIAGIYFIPIAVVIGFRYGWWTWPIVALGVVFVASLPFFFSTFDFNNYLEWFGYIADKPESSENFYKVLRYALFYVLPPTIFAVVAGFRGFSITERAYYFTFLFVIILIIYPAQKPGAGMYYLFPMVPIAIDLSIRFANKCSNQQATYWLFGTIIACIAIVSFPVEKRFINNLKWGESLSVKTEINTILNDYKGFSIEMGLGDKTDSYKYTFLRPILVFSGNPYTLDSSVVMETSFVGIPLAQSTIDILTSCRTSIWLIPRGEEPFGWINYYGVETYDRNFRTEFKRSYFKKEERKYFDIWICKGL